MGLSLFLIIIVILFQLTVIILSILYPEVDLVIYHPDVIFLTTTFITFIICLFALVKFIGPKVSTNKKLLILDMNNLLVYRVFIPVQQQEYPETIPFNALAEVSPNGRFRTWTRPHLTSFIDFCLKNYNVAVWSSARKENVDHLIDLVFGKVKRNLLVFVWGQEMCDQVHPHPDGVTVDKPLFLKDMAKVWKQFPQYNKSNTLLVDDSEWKTMKNPPETVVIIKPWYPHKGAGMSDEGLSERGNVRQELKTRL